MLISSQKPGGCRHRGPEWRAAEAAARGRRARRGRRQWRECADAMHSFVRAATLAALLALAAAAAGARRADQDFEFDDDAVSLAPATRHLARAVYMTRPHFTSRVRTGMFLKYVPLPDDQSTIARVGVCVKQWLWVTAIQVHSPADTRSSKPDSMQLQ